MKNRNRTIKVKYTLYIRKNIEVKWKTKHEIDAQNFVIYRKKLDLKVKNFGQLVIKVFKKTIKLQNYY